MTLERLELRNFQAHGHLEIDLDPGVTTLVGPTDCGKSAVVRGLRWLCLNRPRGTEFLRRGASFCRVSLGLRGRHVSRKRGKSGNRYSLDSREFQIEQGGEVPDEIKDLLNLCEDNFQGQMDPPYWLTATPGEVSRALNAVADLSMADSCLSGLDSELRECRREVAGASGRLDAARKLTEDLSWAEEASALWQEIQALEKEWQDDDARCRLLRRLLEEGEALHRRAEALPPAEDEKLLQAAAGAYGKAHEEAQALATLVDELAALEEESCRLERTASARRKELSAAAGEACPACDRPW